MRTRARTLLPLAVAGVLLTACGGTEETTSGSAEQAAEYPTEEIRLLVPYTAGGPTDTVARLVAERMSADLGQQIVIENMGGAGGTLGAGRVAASDPDGYTVVLASPDGSADGNWRP